MKIIGIDLEEKKVLTDTGVELPITDIVGDNAVIALPDETFAIVDISGEKMTKQ